MNRKVSQNKQGQTLGRKGHTTRIKLMDAAREMLNDQSPVELTAVAIAAAAGTSPATFYMYFDDTTDILYALGEVAGEDMAKVVHRMVDTPWVNEQLEEHAVQVIEAFNEVWNKHRPVLRFRNMEADRGDPRFEELRMKTYIPFIERFAKRILEANPADGGRKRADAYAEASVLHAAIERLAMTEPALIAKYLGARRVNSALARVMAHVLRNPQGPKAASGQSDAKRNGAPRKSNVTAAGTKVRAKAPRNSKAKSAQLA